MDFNFKKKFGQNFLRDNNIISNIIKLVDPNEDDLIIEIGPGAGALSKELVKFNSFYRAFEIDEDTKEYLLPLETDKAKIIYKDFMKVDIKEEIKDIKYNRLFIIGNLPYYITSSIILKILDLDLDVYKQVYMVQKEVADRFASKEGNREYGSITVLLNAYYKVKKEFVVGKNCFYPIPKVDSAIISFEKNVDNQEIINNNFKSVVRDAFQFKRKILRNNFKGYDLEKLESILNEYGFSLNNRAEEIPYDVYIKIAKSL
jgi:16S rRNA (adenine1518-N6/adenine1519-N6)-dimethyltransferase